MARRVVLAGIVLAITAMLLADPWLWRTRLDLSWLDDLPSVTVERAVSPRRPDGVIVHVLDWHPGQAQVQREERLLALVEQVQDEQVEVLRAFARRGMRAFGADFGEGDKGFVQRYIMPLVWAMAQGQHQRRLGNDAAVPPPRRSDEQLRKDRLKLVRLGAVARVMKVETGVRPFWLGDLMAYRLLAGEAVSRRDQALVRNAVAAGPGVVVIVLPGHYDLRYAVREAAPRWGYVRLTTRAVEQGPTR
jgi:hypothetical protein